MMRDAFDSSRTKGFGMNRYVVVRGDNLSKIARRNGLRSWREIYFHSANSAFRELRPDPNLIHPGDTLVIPRPDERVTVPTRRRRSTAAVAAPVNPTPVPPSSTTSPSTPSASPAISTPADEARDAAELADAAIESGQATIEQSTILRSSPLRERVIEYVSRLTADDIRSMRESGVQAVLFGRAATRRSGAAWEYETVFRDFGIQLVFVERQHVGTQLRSGTRVNTGPDSQAVIMLLDFGLIRMRPETTFVVYRPEPRRRRRTSRARLETGALRDRLHELSGAAPPAP